MKNKYNLLWVSLIITILSITYVFSNPNDITNQTYLVQETGQTGNDTNLSVYDYLNLQLSVTSTNTSINNSDVWYQWFLDSVDYVKGFGVNVASFFFHTSDIGNHTISVNSSTTNNSNDVGNTLSWDVNVIEPILEPNDIQPKQDSEVYDSINVFCRHEYTGHDWLYDTDVMALQQNGNREWVSTRNGIVTNDEWTIFDLTNYVDFDNNVSIRCRTYNTNFGFSNYTYETGIIKRSLNQIKLFRPILSPIFIGQLTAFTTDCDMSKSNKYQILYHYVDGNADGTYDKLLQYTNSSMTKRSIFMFDTKFIISGTQKVAVGCVIQKQTNEAWDFSFCKEDQNTCTIQNTYDYEVYE